MDVNLNIADLLEAVRFVDLVLDQGILKGAPLIRRMVAVRDRFEDFVKAVNTNQLNTSTPAALDEAPGSTQTPA